jgi:hypothetical protein
MVAGIITERHVIRGLAVISGLGAGGIESTVAAGVVSCENATKQLTIRLINKNIFLGKSGILTTKSL